HVRSQSRHVRSQQRHVRSPARHVRSQSRHVRSSSRYVRSQSRHVRSQSRHVRHRSTTLLCYLYSLDSFNISRSLKTRLRITPTTVASPIPCKSTVPSLIAAPLTPIPSTTLVKIKFCELL